MAPTAIPAMTIFLTAAMATMAVTARGGGIYMQSGSLHIKDTIFQANSATGGKGGDGGLGTFSGESLFSVVDGYLVYEPGADSMMVAGKPGTGGRGGDGKGGGLYIAGGTLTIESSTITGNYAVGGEGGDGGEPTNAVNAGIELSGGARSQGSRGRPWRKSWRRGRRR